MTVKHIIGEYLLFNVMKRRNFKNASNFEEIMEEGNRFDSWILQENQNPGPNIND